MNKIFSLLIMAALFGCKKHEEVTVKFPVAEESKNCSISKLEEIIGNVEGYSFSYYSFDFQLDSHQEVKGYIQISSEYLKSKSELEGYFNAILLGCHHTSSSVAEAFDLGNLFETLRVQNAYVKIQQGQATVWFSTENANKARKNRPTGWTL